MPGGVKHKERVGEGADSEFSLGLGITEGGKIVLSKKEFRRSAQVDEVKRAGNVVYKAVVEWRTIP